MKDINTILTNLEHADYFANKEIGYALLGAIETGLPLLVEGDPGVGKSSLAVAAAEGFGVPLIRLQCYEGITPESILYDYDYQRQLLVMSAVRDKMNAAMREMTVEESVRYAAGHIGFYGEEFLLERPILRALRSKGRKVLLIDEIDKATEEIEHTLLEPLSDFAMSIPEYGTICCEEDDRPLVILTSNRYRELSAPLKRRCLYLYIQHKNREEIQAILHKKVADDDAFCNTIAGYLDQIAHLDLQHPTSISEGIAWARFLKDSLEASTADDIRESAAYTVGFLAKNSADRREILRSVFGISPDR